jgi:penicillin amidase
MRKLPFVLLGLSACGGDSAPAPADAALVDIEQADSGANGDASSDVPAAPTAEQLAILGVPETAAIPLPGLAGEVHVVRTGGNIPHVYAENRDDLARATGFVQAADRFFFMDLQRRLGLGNLASLLGDVALDQDIESRGTGVTAIVDRLEAHISPDFRSYLQAFADGVNAYIDAVRAGTATPPSETQFAGLLGFDSPADMMHPFGVRDMLALIAVVMHSTNFETDDVGRDRAWSRVDALFEGAPKAELRRAGYKADVFSDVRPIFPETRSTPGFPGREDAPVARRGSPSRPAAKALPEGLLERLDARLTARARRAGKHREAGFGSNVWAVAGSHSEDGWAMLANDGHLSLSIPPLGYAAGLDTTVFRADDPHPPMKQMGGWLGNFPVIIGGTNGKVAFGGVNPVLDITDWYREELRLGADGRPAESRFGDAWKPLVKVDETYKVAEVALLDSVGRDETVARWTTFDGRWLTAIEGRVLADGESPADGETAVWMLGERVVPKDTNDDGVISAVSYDYVAFDATRWPEALFKAGFAEDVDGFREATRGFVGSALFMSAVDSAGSIYYTSYQAVPCRGYLPREAGAFAEGADPTRLLDGTRFGGFTVASDAEGRADESKNAEDPYKCVIPQAEMPQAKNPANGYLFNANNDPAGLTADGDERNDAWHIGGPWSSVRGNTIDRDLAAATADRKATLADMTAAQANHQSRLGEKFTPLLAAAVARAAALATTDGPKSPAEERMAAISVAHGARFAEVVSRLEAWGARGFHAASGVETFYATADADDRKDAVATSILNAWLPRFIGSVWDDEGIDAWRDGLEHRVAATLRLLAGRGDGNPGDLASWDAATGEAVFFDDVRTTEAEIADELMLSALVAALSALEAAPTEPGRFAFGSADMDTWLWGLKHTARFESVLAPYLAGAGPLGAIGDMFSVTTERLPLATGLGADDPRRGLKWFPRPGDHWAVDAANTGLSTGNVSFGYGPAMRLIMALKGGEVKGRFVLPGGQSGVTDSPFFDDQLKLWLANDYHDFRFSVADVVAGASGRERFTPAPAAE